MNDKQFQEARSALSRFRRLTKRRFIMDEEIIKIEKADIAGWRVVTPERTYYFGEYGALGRGCYGNEGVIYKDQQAFETGEGVCYIEEYGFNNESDNAGPLFEFPTKEAFASDIVNNPYWEETGWTRSSLIEACGGDVALAEDLFDHLDWMSPITLLTEWDTDEENEKENNKGGNI